MHALEVILASLSPILVSAVGAYSAITVAKLTKVQKDLKTNHGTSNIGEVVDIIRTRVDSISTSQTDITDTIDHIRDYTEHLGDMIDRLEETDINVPTPNPT